jgi:hypothetical protein
LSKEKAASSDTVPMVAGVPPTGLGGNDKQIFEDGPKTYITYDV